MGWVVERRGSDGRVRFTAAYRDPSGKQRSAGTFTTQRLALRAIAKAESSMETGTWFDVSAGKVTFRR